MRRRIKLTVLLSLATVLAVALCAVMYRIADSEQAKTYGFEDIGEAQTDTGLGKLATHCYMQHREGSSRTTYLWVAPGLEYLPVRIETRKDDQVQTALTLMSVEGIEKR